MTKNYVLSTFLLLLTTLLRAQTPTNYVANTANSYTPGTNNTLVGPGAGSSISTGVGNTFMGNMAGQSTTTGNGNAFIGSNAGLNNTGGGLNSFVGTGSGYHSQTGSNNAFLGYLSGGENISGDGNTFLGSFAGNYNTTGSYNTFVGDGAGLGNTAGTYNVFLGRYTGFGNTKGYSNIVLGIVAGFKNSIGHNNVMIGDSAGYNTTTSGNVMLGSKAGFANQTANQNSFIGYQAGYNTTVGANTFIGYQAGYTNSTGAANVFVGSQAGFSNTTGQGNLFLGQQAGSNNDTGNYNLFIGNGAGGATTGGAGNTAIGDGALLHSTTGQRNVAIGQYSGLNNQTGYDNVFIGYGAKAGTVNPTNITNSVAIGANAIVSQSNAIVLGNGANVGIGTGTPSAKLELVSGVANTAGLKLRNLNSSYVPTVNASKFLTVDGSGNVILASYSAGARIGVDESAIESLWQRKGGYLQSTQGEAIIIGSGVVQTPSEYNLFVSKGILTEKVKVAVKNTAEWSDRVFDKSYPLKSLSVVEQYINANKHLPGIPSAGEVVREGMDVAKMNAKLLEKIEELTLYLIKMEKTNQHLQQEVKKMDDLQKQVNQLLKAAKR